ncbi:hypothetical protein CLG85_024200 [Yangia mangrovi]|uniref:Uncharacterized protein n=1 Tax=Alloyangia mangrovi TaxID=1779329 RepID=A0A2A3JV16_9RHOB|nr:hypothetical protein [Alloyangia mangrovi]MCA0940538.1 hypothetical protein [Alloyangia pacifica]MCA0945900.1 hypothetical protein [Alloyangia pacifica]MCT4373223.1 hypothetical protein [Alloyangia mangrovi]
MTGKAPYAALYLPDTANPDLVQLLKTAGKTLLAHDNSSGRPLLVSRRRLALMGDRMGLCLTHFDGTRGTPRIVLRVLSREGGLASGPKAIALLLEAVRRLSPLCAATEIEWLSPRTRLAPETLPDQLTRPPRKRLAPIDPAAEKLLVEGIRDAMAATLTDPAEPTIPRAPGLPMVVPVSDPAQTRLSLAAWAMTGLLAMLNLPIALVLAAIALKRGMDFRLATQFLTFTVLGVFLDNSGLLNLPL